VPSPRGHPGFGFSCTGSELPAPKQNQPQGRAGLMRQIRALGSTMLASVAVAMVVAALDGPAAEMEEAGNF